MPRLPNLIIEQSFSIPEVGGIEALSKPAINLREHRARFLTMALLRAQSHETGGRTQLERFSALRARNSDRSLEANPRLVFDSLA